MREANLALLPDDEPDPQWVGANRLATSQLVTYDMSQGVSSPHIRWDKLRPDRIRAAQTTSVGLHAPLS